MPQLAPFVMVAPGSLGLNKEKELSLLDPRWSTQAQNMVLSPSGRLGSRKGWVTQTANAIASDPDITALHEWIKGDGTTQMIVATADAIFKDIDDFTDAANDITPATGTVGGNWQFVNFNSKVVGIQRNHPPAVYAGTGDFTYITSTGAPNGGHAGLSAFGRLWILDSDRQTIHYSALLDEDDWDGVGAGQIDMRNVWTQGMDEVTAISALGATLIVFGRNHVVLWSDGSGSEIGLNPVNMTVQDTVEGTGCIARDSIQVIGEGDLLFLSPHGVQSLARVIQSKSNPLETLTKNIKGYLQEAVSQVTDADEIRSAFSPELGLYLLTLPVSGLTIVLNMRKLFRDEDGDLVAVITDWVYGQTPTSWSTTRAGELLLGLPGEVGLYSGGVDGVDTFTVSWRSGWLDVNPEAQSVLKILKELRTKVTLSGATTLTWYWQWDFTGQEFSRNVSYQAPDISEWGTAEWGLDEWSGGIDTFDRNVDGSDEGQFIKIGMSSAGNTADLLLQQVILYSKLGRMA